MLGLLMGVNAWHVFQKLKAPSSAVCGYHIATGVDCDRPATHMMTCEYWNKWMLVCATHAQTGKNWGYDVRELPNAPDQGPGGYKQKASE
jgi:hypothetical protein